MPQQTVVVDNSLIASGTIIAAGSTATLIRFNPSLVTFAWTPGGSMPDPSQSNLSNFYVNYSLTVRTPGFNPLATYKITAYSFVSPTEYTFTLGQSLPGTPSSGGTWELRVGSERNLATSTAAFPGTTNPEPPSGGVYGPVNNNGQAANSFGPQISISQAFAKLDHADAGPHTIYVKKNTYDEYHFNSVPNLLFNPNLATTPVANPISSTIIQGFTSYSNGNFNSLYDSVKSLTDTNQIGAGTFEADFPAVNVPSNGGTGFYGTTGIHIFQTGGGTSSWSVEIRCLKVTHPASGSVLQLGLNSNTLYANVTIDCCVFGDPDFIHGVDIGGGLIAQRGIFDLITAGASQSRNIKILRSKIYSTYNAVEIYTADLLEIKTSYVRVRPKASGTHGLYVHHRDASHAVLNFTEENNDVDLISVNGSSDLFLSSLCIYVQGADYMEQLRMVGGRARNTTRGACIIVPTPTLGGVVLRDKIVQSDNPRGGAMVVFGDDASAAHPNTPDIANSYRLVGTDTTAAGSTNTTLKLGAGISGSNNALRYKIIKMVTGSRRGQMRMITSSNATDAVIDPTWDWVPSGSPSGSPPSAGDVYEIWTIKPVSVAILNNKMEYTRMPYVAGQPTLSYPIGANPNNEARAFNAHCLLIGQGMRNVLVDNNELHRGDNGIVIKGEGCTVTNNKICSGRGALLIKGGSFCVVEFNTAVCAYQGGGGGALDWQDKSTPTDVPSGHVPLQHIYESKSMCCVVRNNILVVLPDHGMFFIPEVENTLQDNDTPAFNDNSIGLGNWAGELPSEYPSMQAGLVDYQVLHRYNPSNYPPGLAALSTAIAGIGGFNLTNLVNIQERWALSARQFKLNDAHSIIGDPLLADPVNGDFRLLPGSPAARAASNGANIGAWQGYVPLESDPRVFSGQVTSLTVNASGLAVCAGLNGAEIRAGDNCSINGGLTVIAEGTVLATTDANGNYSFTLDPGDFEGELVAVHAASSFTSEPLAVDGLVLGQPKIHLNFQSVPEVARVKITIRSSGGNPLSDVTVTPAVTGGGCTPPSPEVTDNNGHASLSIEPDCGYTFTLSKTGYVFTPAVFTLAAVDVEPAQFIAYNAVGTVNETIVSGRVQDGDGVGLEGAVVTFAGTGGQPHLGTATTNAQGLYSKAVPPNWQGQLSAALPGHTFSPTVINVADEDLDPGDELPYQNFTSDVGIGAYEQVKVSGRVLGPCGVPYDSATVVLDGDDYYSTYETTTDADGYYEQLVPKGWSGTVTVSKDGQVFDPASRTVGPV